VKRIVFARLAAFAVAALLVSCESGVVLGTPCTRASECGASLVCRLGACRSECHETRDCPIGAECLPIEAGGVCALATDRCSEDADCTAPLVCGRDGECRAECLTDSDCTDDGACVLAGRLVCVARPPAPAAPCFVDDDGTFEHGLDDWCIETSTGLDPSVVSLVDAPVMGRAAVIDMLNAPVGSWARLTQETPFHPAERWTYDLLELRVDGGVSVTAVELLGEDGAVLGRVAVQQGGGDCEETGRASVYCADGGSSLLHAYGVGGAAAIPFADVDLRRIARVRRVFEVARTREGPLRVGLESVSRYTVACALAWWQDEDHLAELTLDDPRMLPDGAHFTPDDRPIRLFDLGICEQALAIDGTSALDVPVSTTDGPRTISFFWYSARAGAPFEDAALVRELDGDLELVVRGSTLTARAGRCGSAPALEVLDDTVLGASDRRWQEAQLFLDRTAGRLCLARGGHLVGCATTPACPLGPSTATTLRFGELASPLPDGDALGFDEIRVDDAETIPAAPTARSGACYLDRGCYDYARDGVRDSGSAECVLPSDCTTLALCPRGATDPGPTRCSSDVGRMACGWDPRADGSRCPHGVALCGSGVCPPSYTICEETVALDYASCVP
jgi:hypothetical protein